MVEAGECEVASHAPELDVVFALKTAKLGGVSVVQHKAAERTREGAVRQIGVEVALVRRVHLQSRCFQHVEVHAGSSIR